MPKTTNRIRAVAPALKSRSDAEDVLRDIAVITLTRNRAQLDMDREITAIRERYQTTIDAANKTLLEKTEAVRAWAEANPSEFGAAKSLDLVHAVIGWRTGQPQLKTLSGWTWDRVLSALKLRWSHFIRTKEEVDKQAILAARDSLAPEDLRSIGVRVVQDEAFFIEPKLTDLESTQHA